MNGRTRTLTTLLTAAMLTGAATAPRPAHAQSWYLGWLKAAEEWSLQEDYRGWIFHGVIAAAVTLAADWTFDAPEYGAVLGSGFYLGKEFREMALWRSPTTDRVMDMVSPVLASALTAYLLTRGDDEPMPPLLPSPFPGHCPPPPDTGGGSLMGEPFAPPPIGCLALRDRLAPPEALGLRSAPRTLRLCAPPPRRPALCTDS